MKSKPRSEMSKLLWSFTVPILLLVALIIIAFLVYGIVSANNNAKHTKQLLLEQAGTSYTSMGENFRSLSRLSPELIKQFNPEIMKAVIGGDSAPLYGLTKNLTTIVTPAEYVAIIKDGNIIDSANPSGATVDQSKLPTSSPSKGYVVLDSFGGKTGTYMVTFTSVDMSKLGLPGKFSVASVFDMTSQVKKVDDYFQNQKHDTVIGLIIAGIIALILFGLLSTFWLRYLINKYIRRPVDELNTMAQEIAAGTYEGEVVVDESSDFAALRGLLRSGQLILRKFDEKMGD